MNKRLNELKEELKNIEVLLIVNENPLDYITEDDLNSIKKIVTISYFKNDIVNKSPEQIFMDIPERRPA